MQITSKGQVTIPQEIRTRLGLLPYTEVEFVLEGDHVRIQKAPPKEGTRTRGQRVVEALRGTATTGMTADEVWALLRGDD